MILRSSNERIPVPRIGITIGDPAGIGPEVALKSVTNPEVLAVCLPILIGDADYLHAWAKAFGIQNHVDIVRLGEPIPLQAEAPFIYNLKNLPSSLIMGQEQTAAGRAAGEYIETAVQLCQTNQIDAVTTAPINKKALHLGGYEFPGHTEMFAHLTNTTEFAMSFIAPNLRVALLTTHLPLSAVSESVTQAGLETLIQLVKREMIHFGIGQPRIAVAAINPHGGEGGLFGTEETTKMVPAINACRALGIDVSGPYSGDTIFLRAVRGEFDIVISCYHDQGLIPIKCFSFGEAVNVTLGLPFIRTSVDHGTGFDIAGEGKADPASMITAIKLAAEMARQVKGAAA